MTATNSNSFFVVVSSSSGASALQASANSMAVGASLRVHSGGSNGFTSAIVSTGGDNMFNYGGAAHYDPVNREIHCVGQGHLELWRHAKFSESANSWSVVSENPSFQPVGSFGHGYYHSTMDPSGNIYYFSTYSGNSIVRWTRATQTWAVLSAAPLASIANALVWHPTMNKLIYCSATGGVGRIWSFDPSTSAWTILSSPGFEGSDGIGAYHNMGAWCPDHGVVVIGGGNSVPRLWKVASDGTTTRIADCPLGLNIPVPKIVYDSPSQRLLVFQSSTTGYAYNFAANAWTSFVRSGTTWDSEVNHTMLVPVHNRIMLIKGRLAPEVWLYRHA